MILLWLGCAAPSPPSGAVPDTADTGVAPPVDPFEAWVAPVLQARCAGCHGGEVPAGALDLSGDLRAAMVGPRSVQVDLPLVTPGDRTRSYLWLKLEGQQALVDGFGTAMPPDALLPQEDRDRLGGWIDAGAP